MSESSYPYHLDRTSGIDSPSDSSDNGATLHPQPLTDRVAQGAHHTIDRLVDTATPHIERMEGALAGATGHLKAQARSNGHGCIDRPHHTVRHLLVVATGPA